jgi:hypothetical protein
MTILFDTMTISPFLAYTMQDEFTSWKGFPETAEVNILLIQVPLLFAVSRRVVPRPKREARAENLVSLVFHRPSLDRIGSYSDSELELWD